MNRSSGGWEILHEQLGGAEEISKQTFIVCVAGWWWRKEVWAVGSVLIGARAIPLSKSSAWELGGQGRFSYKREQWVGCGLGAGESASQSSLHLALHLHPSLTFLSPGLSPALPEGCLPPHPSATLPSLNFQQGTQRTVIDDFNFNIYIC